MKFHHFWIYIQVSNDHSSFEDIINNESF